MEIIINNEKGPPLLEITSREMQKWGIQSGDVLVLSKDGTKMACVAVVAPSSASEMKSGQLTNECVRNGHPIQNTQSVVVVVERKLRGKVARIVELSYLSGGDNTKATTATVPTWQDLFGFPMVEGFTVNNDYVISRVSDSGCVVGINTLLRAVPRCPSPGSNDGDDVYVVTEMAEMLFKRVVVNKIKGVLLHGPPGSGKTKCLKSVLKLCQAHGLKTSLHDLSLLSPLSIAASSVSSSGRMVTVGSDVDIAFVLVDEIDALKQAPRDEAFKASLKSLFLMDKVVVVATTNLKDAVDPSLRRGGRLEIELYCSHLSRKDRLKMIKSHHPLITEELALEISERTNGYLAADLAGLLGTIKAKTAAAEEINLEEVLAQNLPAVLRGVQPVASLLSFDDIVGQQEAKSALHRVFKQQLPGRYEGPGLTKSTMGDPSSLQPQHVFDMSSIKSGGVLLHGPPGNGKSRLVQAAARHFHLPLISVSSADVYSPYVGDAEAAIRNAFARGRQAAPCVLFFDELDAIVTNRELSGGGSSSSRGNNASVESRVLASMLNEMDGVASENGASGDGIIVLGATNRVTAIDAALLRKGRFQRLVLVNGPTPEEQGQILTHFASKFSLSADVIVRLTETLVTLNTTEGVSAVSGADIENMCKEELYCRFREDKRSESDD